VRGWLAGFYAAQSADTMAGEDGPDVHVVRRGGRLRDRFPTDVLPAWLSPEDLDHYAGEFERTGMTGALNRYRNVDRDWEDLAGHRGHPLTQPSLFIGGALDASTTWMADAIAAFPTTTPGSAGTHLLDGVGHWVQQERPDEVNRLLTGWLGDVASRPAVQAEHAQTASRVRSS
jgi:pimeloyl-ACP methyl ester carboxylesterase